MFYHSSIERWVGKIQIKSAFCKPGETFTAFKLCTLYFLCKQTLDFDNILTSKSVIICHGEDLFTGLMKSSINCWGLQEGKRWEWSREYNQSGRKIIVRNSFHFIRPPSWWRQGHGDERWEGVRGGGSVEKLIAEGKLLLACELREKGWKRWGGSKAKDGAGRSGMIIVREKGRVWGLCKHSVINVTMKMLTNEHKSKHCRVNLNYAKVLA